MARVAFATYRQAPALTDDDRLAADALRARGVETQPVVWNAPDVDWARFDLTVIRSTWDYPDQPAAYARWVEGFLPQPGRLWNPAAVVLSTLDKRYLIGLAEQGVEVVPTAAVATATRQRLRDIIERHGWDEVVIKPAISASARGTWRSRRATAEDDQARFAVQSIAQDLLVQPYCPEIAARGEWSLVFFGGEYSHAVLKRPAPGDFRVQRHFGGTGMAAAPGAELIEHAAAVLPRVGEPLLYARVDGIERDGSFVLMELEVNEPHLFLSSSRDAPVRFADAIVRVLRR
jgi:glutathione synthase/RimK-type ligase-like ATP-grasp enzyme